MYKTQIIIETKPYSNRILEKNPYYLKSTPVVLVKTKNTFHKKFNIFWGVHQEKKGENKINAK